MVIVVDRLIFCPMKMVLFYERGLQIEERRGCYRAKVYLTERDFFVPKVTPVLIILGARNSTLAING